MLSWPTVKFSGKPCCVKRQHQCPNRCCCISEWHKNRFVVSWWANVQEDVELSYQQQQRSDKVIWNFSRTFLPAMLGDFVDEPATVNGDIFQVSTTIKAASDSGRFLTPVQVKVWARCCLNVLPQESNGPTDNYAAIAQVDIQRQEPESLRKWREEQKTRLEVLGEQRRGSSEVVCDVITKHIESKPPLATGFANFLLAFHMCR